MIVISIANDTWRFRPGQCSVWIFTRWCLVALFRLWLLLLLLLLLLSYLIFGFTSFIKRRGRRRGRIGRSRRLGGISGIIYLLSWPLRSYSILNDRSWEKPYGQADRQSRKWQCGHMRCTNFSPRGERTRVSPEGNPLVGGPHFPQPKINVGKVIFISFKINFRRFNTTCFFQFLRVEKKQNMTLVAFDF